MCKKMDKMEGQQTQKNRGGDAAYPMTMLGGLGDLIKVVWGGDLVVALCAPSPTHMLNTFQMCPFIGTLGGQVATRCSHFALPEWVRTPLWGTKLAKTALRGGVSLIHCFVSGPHRGGQQPPPLARCAQADIPYQQWGNPPQWQLLGPGMSTCWVTSQTST